MRNRLVLVAPGSVHEEVAATTNLTAILVNAKGLVAMGDPGHVPAGRYAREALQALGVYDGLAGDGRLLFTPNVRAALAVVELGECDLGIVYATDALRGRTVRTLGSFPAETHGPIDYAVVCAADASHQARAFAAFLCSAETAVLLEHHGFEPVSSARP
jgi:molybdate transport system substrate-binding protein